MVVRPWLLPMMPFFLTKNSKTCRSELKKIQRLTCQIITTARRTAPITALEVFLDISSLHLCVDANGL